ncbi:MAG TPA: hypothetical protein DCZ94_17090 [Lentisphaeria bacterium]|nr:MAG: hypothetical protein A2X48_21090 [Lentisphaerae bacterium GWF2_49_21]HBC88663.1 hypothetical protein [Lentisphaeria bacterium]
MEMKNKLIDKTDSRPFVSQIRDRIRAQIRSGKLQVDQKIPSMRELERECGVSLGIVKMALNSLTTEGYLRSHPGKGLYVSSPKQNCQNIALVIPALDFEKMPKIIKGVKEVLKDKNLRLMIMAADCDFNQEMELVKMLDPSLFMGAIIYPPPVKEVISSLIELVERRMPFVQIDTVHDSVETSSVRVDHVMLAQTAFHHLLSNGHRRIGVVDHSGDSISHRDLRRGADLELRKSGLSFFALPREITDVRDLNEEEPWLNGERSVLRMLEKYPDLTAIIGINDNLSLGALRGAKKAGRIVSKDLSVLAIGDLNAFAISDPPLSAVAQPFEDIGREAARCLVDMINGDSTRPEEIKLNPYLIDRGSVSSPNR